MNKPNYTDREQSMQNPIHKLTLESIAAESRQNLIFRILNNTIELCRYDRAVLWDISGKKPKPLGVSGTAELNPDSETLRNGARLLEALPDIGKPQKITEDTLPSDACREWSSLSQAVGELSVVWLPISSWGNQTAGLWLERWEGRTWNRTELEMLKRLSVSYESAWERLAPRTFLVKWRQRLFPNKTVSSIAGLVLILLVFLKVPLRIIAPCEVVPKDPVAVTAPLDGVIEKVVIPPYHSVNNGDLLVLYDKRDVEEELNLAEQQVRIIMSELERIRVQAMMDAGLRSEIKILEGRLEQEKIRRKLAEYRASKLEIRAGSEGIAVIDNPEEWSGRPVVIGERILTLVVPSEVELRIWLPVDDNIAFDREKPVKVVLNVNPDSSKKAILEHIGQHVTAGPTKIPVVMARAEFTSIDQDIKSGMQGTAVLYGERVRLIYWLLRKPLFAIRKITGV